MRSTVAETSPTACEIEVFFDGGCPLCLREVTMLRGWDKRDKIRFNDVHDPFKQSDTISPRLVADVWHQYFTAESLTSNEFIDKSRIH